MTLWSFWETVAVVHIGKRLGLMLLIVTGYCLVAGVAIRKWDIRVADWAGAGTAINTVILGLLMSFRNRAAYDRWWEARKLWGQLTNDSRNLAAKMSAFVPIEVLAGSRIAETLSGFAVALKRHLRDQSPRLRDLRGFENATDDPAHVPLYLAGRVFTVVAEWKSAGHLDNGVLWIFDPHMRGLLDVCGACERIHNTPLSPSYKGLLRTGLVLNLIAAPWLTMPEIGFWAVPVLELTCFFLLGVELIDTVVEDPFGQEGDDLDLDRYCRTIRDGVAASLPLASKVG